MEESATNKLKSSMVKLVAGQAGPGEALPRVLYRYAASALRNAGGGRVPEAGAERDLVQDFFIKLWARRRTVGVTALVAEWEAMSAASFAAYVKKALRNLAVERNPVWDRQRGLRDVVVAVLAGPLPGATGWPASLERNGRLVRGLVAEACAMALATGTPRDVKALTSRLMAEFAFANPVDAEADVEASPSEEPSIAEVLATRSAGDAVVTAFLAEEGEAGRELLRLRKLGFKAMAERLGLALATAHGRFVRVETRLKAIAERLGADRDAVARAVEVLAA